MPRIDNTKFYHAALKKYGVSAEGVNWNSEHSQIKRFEIIYKLLKTDLSKNTVADAGCGFGDFYLYLKEQKEIFSYIGVDIVLENIEIAKERTNQKILQKDILTDSLPKADFYIASGSMNIMNRFETWLFIRRCFDYSKKGFIFNLLKGREQKGSFNYFLPREIRHFAKNLPCEVTIIEGYLDNDFTVYLKRV